MHFLGLFTLHYTYVMLHIFTALFCCRERREAEWGGLGLQSLTLLSLMSCKQLSMHQSPRLQAEDGRDRSRHWGPSMAQSLSPRVQHPRTPSGTLMLCQGMQEG